MNYNISYISTAEVTQCKKGHGIKGSRVNDDVMFLFNVQLQLVRKFIEAKS